MKILQYILLRVSGVLLTTLVGAAVVFFAMQAMPGDPALSALGEHASPEAIARFRAEHHLDAPLAQQFLHWLWGIMSADLGQSMTLASDVPISHLLVARIPNTVFIGIYAILLALMLAMTMGTIAAIKHGKAPDTIATSFAVLGVSMPDFWLGFVLILVFALTLGLFPAYGFESPLVSFAGALHSGFLPALAVAAPMAAVFARTLRSALLENMRKDYVTVARSFGFSRSFVFWNYIFRNSIIAFVVIVGLQVRYLLGGVVVIERVFGIPGIGSLMVDAAFARDYAVVQACAIVFLVTVLVVNLVVDIVCALLDPKRTR